MLNVLLAAAMSYPGIFANEYCWSRHHGETHEAAIELAKGRWGGLIYNQEAEDLMRKRCELYTEWRDDQGETNQDQP